MATEIRIKLLKLVLNNPEIKRDEIHAHKDFEDEEDRTLANLLYNVKKDGQCVADESMRYTITAKGRSYLGLKGGESKAPAAPKSKQRSTLPPKPGPRLRGHREDSNRGRRARPGHARSLPDHRWRSRHHRPAAQRARLGA